MVYRGKVQRYVGFRAIEVPGWVPDFEEDCEDEYESNDGTPDDEGLGRNFEKFKDLEGESDIEARDRIKIGKREEAEVSDYFVMVRGVWVPSGKSLLIISIYAPQELSEKRMLWDYLRLAICNWDGDVVTMGDFNEVRDCSERFGSVFNKQVAKFFNDFIAKWQFSGALFSAVPSISFFVSLDREFTNRISSDHAVDLESAVSKEEIKRAVWDCGIDKSPESQIEILVNRLVMVLGDLVRDTQSAFVKDKNIGWVDLLKTPYLKKFGFGDKWCNWIGSCLQSFRGSVLVNGSPTSEFQFFKGLKQGDPLSPLLFILVMESLHVLFQRVVDAVNRANMIHYLVSLDVFHRASGLRINMNKSKLMGISVESSKVEHAVEKIGCMALNMPFKYLGSKVGDLMSRTILGMKS
ncbi:RNA-directed DNA polymerase, eukaryota [Tanacetum coccineum]